jgi:hypothetical protein
MKKMEDKIVYNEKKTKRLNEYDLEKGYLKVDTLTIHHNAIEAQEEEGHYETIREYDNGGKDVKWVIDKPRIEAQEAYDETIEVNVYIPYTKKELADMEIMAQIEEKQQEMNNYKMMLASSDYEAIKYAEGWFTEEEYEPIKSEREKIREEIRKIEEDIKNLEKI